MAVFRVDYQARCGYEIAMTPALDVAEAYEFVAVERHYGFSAGDFSRDIFGRAACYACAALQG